VVTRRRLPFSGWGRTAPTVGELAHVRVDRGVDELAATVKDAPPRGVIARGLGRSYGDPAQNSGGLVVQLDGGTHRIVLDAHQGTVTASGAVSLDELLRYLVPRGFFVPVTPGTRFVTVGGAIASDIHGKNHHVEGSFGNHVRRLSLLLADGTVAEVGPDQRPDLFWATVGGMGLTGIIVDATFGLIPIETSRCIVDTYRVPDLDTLMGLMSQEDADFRYSVAWIDPMAKGAHLGRSVLTHGEHARLSDLPPKMRSAPRAYNPKQLISVPLVPPISAINHTSVAAFNELWYRRAPRERLGALQGFSQYFHPLDAIGHWNRLYGPSGVVQYQFVVPLGEERALQTVIERFAMSGMMSFLSVLKRFGPSNPAPLSFPRPGWTLALDIPAGITDVAPLLHSLDDLVHDAGGRLYLAKDGHATAATFRRGYPRLAEWQAVRNAVDPTGVWMSDQARRLGLHG
jgi:decaprenylphospho-beta-D-ribofuranose 2-oxidase